uniref:XK-related protein n=1 Tax=Mola mola TaxID=94237 RepID=A0A3Q3VQE1_MOLML
MDGTLTERTTVLRWLLTIAGLLLHVVDVWTDMALVLKYFQERHFLWTGLTLVFVLSGLVVMQIFSFAWYRDDMNDALLKPEGKTSMPGLSKCSLAVLHLHGVGIFFRYYFLIKRGFKVLWRETNSCSEEERKYEHHRLFCLAADLSMLRLLESFLESVPQLLLQLYIVLGHQECSVMQYLSMTFSFLNVAWALVDYQRCLRRSFPNVKDMLSGLPTAVYFLYKLCTIMSHLLSYTLLLILSTYSSVALAVIWLLGTAWTHLLQTDFCSSRGLELLYRAVIGFILTFTFFNVKGRDTRAAMTAYYLFHSLINMAVPLLLALLRPELVTPTVLLSVSGLVLGGSVLGLACLVIYYLFLHPSGKWLQADEVDGLGDETETTSRLQKFLQP